MKTKIIILIIGLFVTRHTWAQECSQYFKNQSKIDFLHEITETLSESSKRFADIDRYRQSYDMDNQNHHFKLKFILNQLRLEHRLREVIAPGMFHSMVESLADPHLQVLSTQDIVMDTLLVSHALRAKREAQQLRQVSGNVVSFASRDVFAQNSRHSEALDAVYGLIASYFKMEQVEMSVRLDRILFLVSADARFEELSKYSQEKFLDLLESSQRRREPLRLIAESYFKRTL